MAVKKAVKKSKYDTHIKPFLKEIKEMYELGYTEFEIYNTLQIGKDCWAKYKKEKKELSEALNKEKRIKNELAQLIEFKSTVLPISEYNRILNDIVQAEENKDAKVILQILRQQHPSLNHYLEIEKEKNQISWHEAETKRIQAEKNTINLNTDVRLDDELIDALKGIAPNIEEYNQNETK